MARSRVNVISLCLLSALLVVAIGAAWIKFSIDARWKAMERRIASLEREAHAVDPRRPVLFGNPIPGDSYADYSTALNLFQGQTGRYPHNLFLVSLEDGNRVNERTSAQLQRLGPAFDLLRRGARCSEAQFPRDWQEIPETPAVAARVPLSLRLSSAAALEARRLADNGNFDDALSLLFATLQFGRDIGHNAPLDSSELGRNCGSAAIGELRRVVTGEMRSRARHAEVARVLELIEQSQRDDSDALRNSVLAYGEYLQRGDFLSQAPHPTWRQAWSRKLQLADAFFRAEEWSMRLSAAGKYSFDEERLVRSAIIDEAKSCPNLLARIHGPGVAESRGHRYYLAQLRLVRVAAHFRATGELLDEIDPLGTRFLHDQSGKHLKLWSAGRQVQVGGVDPLFLEVDAP